MFLVITLAFIFAVSPVLGAMQSASYVIYENIHHSFDGPIISNVTDTVSGTTATVTWDTDSPSDHFVVYSANPSLLASSEQGSASASATSHSVDVVGLEYSTLYYYQVKSKRINGGISTSAIGTFTSGAAPPEPEPAETVSTGGGGMLIIDKTDKFAPEITDVNVVAIDSDTATINWTTNEEATSFVEFGLTENFGNVFGEWSSSTEHSIKLINLKPANIYNFRALSSDTWGNVGYSESLSFTTLTLAGEEPTEEEIGQEVDPLEEELNQLDRLTLEEASRRALEIINRMASQVSLNVLEPTLNNQITAIEQLARIIPAPILSGQPSLQIDPDRVVVSWNTDKDANSLVAIASDELYNPDAAEPYSQIVGDSETLTTNHEVRIFELEPSTLYHYQVRSKAAIGPTARSGDFTFRTTGNGLEITSFYSERIDDNSAVFKWVTNKEADSEVTFTPFRGNVLSVEEGKTVKNNVNTIIHEATIEEFLPGIFYNITIKSTDTEGNSDTETLDNFSTSEEDNPPEITQIKTDSTIFVDRGKVQTIISWQTNEPATTRVYFMEGVQAADKELKDSTDLTGDYTKEHIVVINSFKPGTVYSFRVESIDSGSHATLSKLFTFMTPKKRESIIDIIIRILENTFGWVKDIM